MGSEQNDRQKTNRTPPASLGQLEHDARGESHFINEKELLVKLPISRRTLFNWRTAGKIPCVRLGGRRILFHWPSVEAALLRYQR
jgi:predicted DNA-binding transcriptional regulator AlpA